jgi:hypothetical protein
MKIGSSNKKRGCVLNALLRCNSKIAIENTDKRN